MSHTREPSHPRGNAPGGQSERPDRALLILLVMAAVTLALGGMGSVRASCLVGLVLCLAGLRRESLTLDTRAVAWMLLYGLASAVSALAHGLALTDGYLLVHAVFLVLYLLLAGLPERDAALLRRLLAVWAAAAASYCLVSYCLTTPTGVGRLTGILANPNDMGSFLMLGWFALEAGQPAETEQGFLPGLLRRLEPLLLATLAVTLSMGSFLSLAVGMAVLTAQFKRGHGWKETLLHLCGLLARAAVAFGLGLLLNITRRKLPSPLPSLGVTALIAAAAWFWPRLRRLLDRRRWIGPALTVLGAALAVTVVFIRPWAADNFVLRLKMMRNGLTYFFKNPVLGVGAYQWRPLNAADSDIDYRTWYIHSTPIHIAAELGVFAAAAIVAVFVRRLRKKGGNTAGFCAFLFHNLIDTYFFDSGVTALALLTTAAPREKGRRVSGAVVNGLLLGLAALFLYGIAAAFL